MKTCAKCQNTLKKQRKNWIEIDECSVCKSVFLEFSELKNFIDGVDMHHSVEDASEIKKWDGKKDHIAHDYTCPWCESEMHEREFNYGSGIHIDFCKWCGATFLGESELKEILDFEYTRKHSHEWKKLRMQIEQMWNRANIRQDLDYKAIQHDGIISKMVSKIFR